MWNKQIQGGEKHVECKVDDDTNCNQWTWNCPKMSRKLTGRTRDQKKRIKIIQTTALLRSAKILSIVPVT